MGRNFDTPRPVTPTHRKNHAMNKTTRATALLLGASVYAASTHAFAFSYTDCHGAVTWHNFTSLLRDTCSAPNGSAPDLAYRNAFWSWFWISPGVASRFNETGTYSANCTITNGNGRNEFATVPRAAINGLNGLTVTRRSSCVFTAAEFTEGDVELAGDMSFANEDESFFNQTNSQQGQVVIAHELGHFIGLQHTESFDIMRAATPYPLVGGSGDGVFARGWHGAPYPDDAAGARFLYPGNAVTNLFASAQQFSNNAVTATGPSTTVNLCRGSSFNLTYTVGNNGITDVFNYGFRIYLTQQPGVAGGGVDLFTSGGAGSTHSAYWTETRTLTVPWNLPLGTWSIQWQADTGNVASESVETDNFVHSAMTISVGC